MTNERRGDDRRIAELEKDMPTALEAAKQIPIYGERIVQQSGALDRLDSKIDNGLDRLERKLDAGFDDSKEAVRDALTVVESVRRTSEDDRKSTNKAFVGFIISVALAAIGTMITLLVAVVPKL